jgi:hypothetical protein
MRTNNYTLWIDRGINSHRVEISTGKKTFEGATGGAHDYPVFGYIIPPTLGSLSNIVNSVLKHLLTSTCMEEDEKSPTLRSRRHQYLRPYRQMVFLLPSPDVDQPK